MAQTHFLHYTIIDTITLPTKLWYIRKVHTSVIIHITIKRSQSSQRHTTQQRQQNKQTNNLKIQQMFCRRTPHQWTNKHIPAIEINVKFEHPKQRKKLELSDV